MLNYSKPEENPSIPVQLTEAAFDEFILDQLPKRTCGPKYRLSRYKMFNYVVKFVYMGCQWKMLSLDKDEFEKTTFDLLYLPSSSLDFNPIEQDLAIIKKRRIFPLMVLH